MQARPIPGYSLIVRTRYQNQIGMLASITGAISERGGDITAVDIVESGGGYITRDFTINVQDREHAQACVEAVRKIPNLRIINVSDRVFLLHLGGKLEVRSRVPVRTRDDLMMVYTPGVGRVARAIQEDPEKVFTLTIKRNLVGIVTDGSWVPGLGSIGPSAAIPVMEGKAVLFREFASVDAFPISLNTQDPAQIIETLRLISPVFGAIDLEHVIFHHSFEIERELQSSLDIPVFQGDRHGAAIVALAAMTNAARLVDKPLEKLRVVISGTGATATACAYLFYAAGIRHVVVGNAHGILHEQGGGVSSEKPWLLEHTNPDRLTGELRGALKDADVFIGVSGSGSATVDDIRTMAPHPIVFTLENYNSTFYPEELDGVARIVGTGRTDLPNQVTNVLCVPGFFRGLLDSRASGVNDAMKLAAARTLAGIVPVAEQHEEYILPSIFDKRVVPAIASTVAHEAERAGLARRQPHSPEL